MFKRSTAAKTAIAAALGIAFSGSAMAVDGPEHWTASSATLQYTNLDGDSGFRVAGERRARGALGLAATTDYLNEDYGPLTHGRFRAGLGPGSHFEAGGFRHYAALIVGARGDQFNRGVSNEAGWYTQGRYELLATPNTAVGLNLAYTDVDNFGDGSEFGEGVTAELTARYQVASWVSIEGSYLSDFDDVEGEDRLKIGARFHPSWLQ